MIRRNLLKTLNVREMAFNAFSSSFQAFFASNKWVGISVDFDGTHPSRGGGRGVKYNIAQRGGQNYLRSRTPQDLDGVPPYAGGGGILLRGWGSTLLLEKVPLHPP